MADQEKVKRGGIIETILNFGVKEGFDANTIRLCRQVNGLNLFYVMVAASIAILMHLFIKNSNVLVMVQIVATMLYAGNLVLTKTGLIRIARLTTILTFESQMFLIVLMTNTLQSSVVFLFVLYPLLAVLVETSVIKHVVVALAQIGALFIFHYGFPNYEALLYARLSLESGPAEVIRLLAVFYLPPMAGTIIGIIFNENLKAREKQRELLEKQRDLINQVTQANNNIKIQMLMAQRIQESIIPKHFPQNEMFDFHGVYLPVDDIGGDFYDVYKINDKQIGLVIADVSGHGVSAALLTMVAKTLFSSHSKLDLSTGEIVGLVNKDLFEIISDIDNYLTAFYCKLDVESMEMEYTSAGHNDVYVIRKNGELKKLSGLDSIMGKNSEVTFKSERIKLEHKDKIILYTDGIPEARNVHKEFYSHQRFIDSLKRHVDMPLHDLTHKIIGDVNAFSDSTAQNDDISLMVVDVVGDKGLPDLDGVYARAAEKYRSNDFLAANALLSGIYMKYHRKADNFKVANLLGFVSVKLGDYSGCIRFWEQALELDPGNEKLVNNINVIKNKILVKPDRAAATPSTLGASALAG